MINLKYFNVSLGVALTPITQACLELCLDLFTEMELNQEESLYILATILYETNYFKAVKLYSIDSDILKIEGAFPLINDEIIKDYCSCLYLPTNYNEHNEKDFEQTIQIIIIAMLKGFYTGYPLSKFIDGKNILDLYNARRVISSLETSKPVVDIYERLKFLVET